MCNYIPIHGLQPMVWLDGQGLGRNDWKIGGKVNRTLGISKKYVKIFVSFMTGHQRVTSAKEDFNNQVGRMTHSVTSQPLPQPLLSSPNGLMNKMAWW